MSIEVCVYITHASRECSRIAREKNDLAAKQRPLTLKISHYPTRSQRTRRLVAMNAANHDQRWAWFEARNCCNKVPVSLVSLSCVVQDVTCRHVPALFDWACRQGFLASLLVPLFTGEAYLFSAANSG
jgi:hypothetical protein